MCAAPTRAPTPLPTTTPSPGPTAAPTYGENDPTPVPTAAPTAVPTPAPTADPTTAPTAGPTAGPTAEPTAATPPPTALPTAAPTAGPTAAPTAAPTAQPTAGPTAAPTAAPTTTPTARPTATPTRSPTAAPTVVPTAAPSAVPTAAPTVEHSIHRAVLNLTTDSYPNLTVATEGVRTHVVFAADLTTVLALDVRASVFTAAEAAADDAFQCTTPRVGVSYVGPRLELTRYVDNVAVPGALGQVLRLFFFYTTVRPKGPVPISRQLYVCTHGEQSTWTPARLHNTSGIEVPEDGLPTEAELVEAFGATEAQRLGPLALLRSHTGGFSAFAVLQDAPSTACANHPRFCGVCAHGYKGCMCEWERESPLITG